jgi:hypothetical protein
MVQTKNDIFKVIKKNAPRLRSLGVSKIGLFGSFIKGDQHQGSDIDFLVEFEPSKKTFDNFYQLSVFLEEILQRRVEIVTPESLSPYLGPYILREVEDATLVA